MVEVVQIIKWILSVALILFFVFAASVNLYIAWRELILRRFQGVSVIPLVGGLIGYAGMKICPASWLGSLAWVALVIDYGCVPYLVFALGGLIWEKIAEHKGM